MTRIRRRMLAAGLTVAAMVAGAGEANATRFTETANFWLVDDTFGSGPPINLIELQGLSGQGGLFTNTFGLGMVPGTVAINTVGANRVAGGELPGGAGGIAITSPVNQGTATDDQVIVIYALTGTATPTGPNSAAAVYSAGKAIVITHDPGTAGAPTLFNDRDPSTWQYLGIGGANVLAVYDLVPADAVTKGANGDFVGSPPAFTIPAQDVNFSNINTQTDQLTQGIFLFDFAGDGPAIDVLNNPPGPFQQNTPPLTGDPNTEGLIVFAENTNIVDAPINAAQLAVLNSIMSDSTGTPFATGLGAAFSDYNPAIIGDFFNEVGINANPLSVAGIPEPATLALGAMGVAGLLFGSRRRRNA